MLPQINNCTHSILSAAQTSALNTAHTGGAWRTPKYCQSWKRRGAAFLCVSLLRCLCTWRLECCMYRCSTEQKHACKGDFIGPCTQGEHKRRVCQRGQGTLLNINAVKGFFFYFFFKEKVILCVL